MNQKKISGIFFIVVYSNEIFMTKHTKAQTTAFNKIKCRQLTRHPVSRTAAFQVYQSYETFYRPYITATTIPKSLLIWTSLTWSNVRKMLVKKPSQSDRCPSLDKVTYKNAIKNNKTATNHHHCWLWLNGHNARLPSFLH